MQKNTSQNKPKLPKRIRNHVNPLSDQQVINFKGFADIKPIIMDIGAYKGEFSEQLVQKFSDTHNFIVTEIRLPFANYLTELFKTHDSVAVFSGDSARNISGLLSESVAKGSAVDYVFVNFPDPWFKDKHKKRRVVNPAFMTELQKLFTADSTLIFQTDQQQLFEETMEVIQRLDDWSIKYFDEPLWGITSHWEDMKVSEGDRVWRAKIILDK